MKKKKIENNEMITMFIIQKFIKWFRNVLNIQKRMYVFFIVLKFWGLKLKNDSFMKSKITINKLIISKISNKYVREIIGQS